MISFSGEEKLDGVHPDLVRVVRRAVANGARLKLTEGVRTLARQRALVAAGKSRTMNSRHIRAKNGYGHAVDLYPVVNGAVQVNWLGGSPATDRLHPSGFHALAAAIKRAAKQEGVRIEWGGDWRGFIDGPHWQLPWSVYDGSGADPAVADLPRNTPRGLRHATEDDRTVPVAAVTGAGSGGIVAVERGDQIITQMNSAEQAVSKGSVIGLVIGLVIIGVSLVTLWDWLGRPTPWRKT